ncbi:MAG: class I SAM-dependent methyltransferase [Alphaproteobacteria bacterium]
MFRNAEAYERVMGRWSRRLAPLLIGFGGLSDRDSVLDVGCGTGSLTFSLPLLADIAAATGIDISEAYVEYARSRNTDRRIRFEQADACALPFEDHSFDRAFSLLVLQFVPEPARAVAEMRRVVHPGGTVTAAVWDDVGGLPHIRMLFDIAAVLDRSVKRPYFRPLSAPDDMAVMWRATGLTDVEQTSLLIRMEFSSFDDYWSPFTTGEGPPGQLLASLTEPARTALQDHVRYAYLAGKPDGPRSFAAVAWACRGTVPE